MADSGPSAAELGIKIELAKPKGTKPQILSLSPEVKPVIDIVGKNSSSESSTQQLKQEVDKQLLDIRKKLYDLLAPYKVTAENMRNIFDYGQKNFQNFDQISIFLLDEKALQEFRQIAGEIFYAQEFLQNQSTRGIFLAGYDAVLVKQGEELQENGQAKSIRQISEEAAIIHELAHASAENIVLKKVDPKENGGVEYKPIRIGLEASLTDKVQRADDWVGMFIEEGFAQDHYGRYIATHYSEQQRTALLEFLGSGFTYEESQGATKLVINQKIINEDGSSERKPMAIDPELVFLDNNRLMVTPPSYATVTFRELCRINPDFKQKVEQARRDPGGFDSFWSEMQQTQPHFYERFYNGKYIDPFNSNNSFKSIAFDYFNSIHKPEELPTTKILYIN